MTSNISVTKINVVTAALNTLYLYLVLVTCNVRRSGLHHARLLQGAGAHPDVRRHRHPDLQLADLHVGEGAAGHHLHQRGGLLLVGGHHHDNRRVRRVLGLGSCHI